jgi:hypothetical protein
VLRNTSRQPQAIEGMIPALNGQIAPAIEVREACLAFDRLMSDEEQPGSFSSIAVTCDLIDCINRDLRHKSRSLFANSLCWTEIPMLDQSVSLPLCGSLPHPPTHLRWLRARSERSRESVTAATTCTEATEEVSYEII